MVVKRQRPHDRIVLSELRAHGFGQQPHRRRALVAAFDAAMARGAERHVLIPLPQPSRRAMVVVAARDDEAMDLRDERFIDRPVVRNRGDPRVGRDRRGRLLLGTRVELLGRFAQRGVELLLGEFGALDARRAGDLALQLEPLQLVGPAALIGDLGQREHGRFGACQLGQDAVRVVANPPAAGKLVSNDHDGIKSDVVSDIK